MKIRAFILAATAILGFALLAPVTSAQEVATQDNAKIVETIVLDASAQNVVLDLLLALVERFPWMATVITILGSMRLWAKPAVSLIHSIIELTPSKWDDGIWARTYRFLTETTAGKFLAYLLDWFTSVKLPPKKPANPAE